MHVHAQRNLHVHAHFTSLRKSESGGDFQRRQIWNDCSQYRYILYFHRGGPNQYTLTLAPQARGRVQRVLDAARTRIPTRESGVPLYVLNNPRTWGCQTHPTPWDAITDLKRTVSDNIVRFSPPRAFCDPRKMSSSRPTLTHVDCYPFFPPPPTVRFRICSI